MPVSSEPSGEKLIIPPSTQASTAELEAIRFADSFMDYYGQRYQRHLRGEEKIFEGTPYNLTLGHPGPNRNEINSTSGEQLRTEPLNKYFHHLLMLDDFQENLAGRGVYFSAVMDRIDDTQTIHDFLEKFHEGEDLKKRETNFLRQLQILSITYITKLVEINPTFQSDPNSINKLYSLGRKHLPKALGAALELDRRNKPEGKSVDIENRFLTEITEDLLAAPGNKPDENVQISAQLAWAHAASSELMPRVLKYALLKADSNDQIKAVVQGVVPWMGLESLRKTLREYVTDNPSFRDKFEAVFEYLNLDKGDEISASLRHDVYEKINFSEYKPNRENQQFEENLLKQELASAQDVLDVACGTGRLLTALDGQNGMRVVGIDVVKKHIEYIKEKNPSIDAVLGSWFKMPFADNSFEAIYCLGRSFTHNTTIPDAVSCLSEMGRVVKPGGAIILDLPDPSVGEYKELVERTKNAARENHITNFLPGTINDSPDNRHFFDRLALNAEQFRAVARIADFEAQIISSKDYTGESGENNKNIYWKLKKIPDQIPLNNSEVFDFLCKIYPDFFPVADYDYKISLGQDPLKKIVRR